MNNMITEKLTRIQLTDRERYKLMILLSFLMEEDAIEELLKERTEVFSKESLLEIVKELYESLK